MEDVPRVEAEPGADLQRQAHAVEDQAGVELQESSGHGQHGGGRVALNSIANSEKVALVLPDRGLSGPHLARLLGSWRSSGPAYASLARALRLLVLDGRLPLRTRLPGERELAEALGVSRTTATAAYAALRDEGFLASRRGSGSWTRLPADRGRAGRARPVRRGRHRPQLRRLRGARGRAARRARRRLGRAAAPPARPGLRRRRAADAARGDRRALHRAAALPTAPEQVLVTAGALHAFTLLLRVLAGAGRPRPDRAPDLPGGARRRPRRRRAARSRCRCCAGGWDLDMLEATLRQAAPRLAYVIPEHQNPTGLTMPAADRERLVALTRASRTPLVVDETIAGLHLDGGAPPPPVAALDPDGETAITIGSMSKAYWAGMRIGWIRANPALDPPPLRRPRGAGHLQPGARAARRRRAAGGTPTRCCERQRAAARSRRDAFVAALRRAAPAVARDARRRAACRCGSSSTRRAAPRSPRSPTATGCASPPARASASTARSSASSGCPF